MEFLWELLFTCFIASTHVTVFPVPGGPKTMYGKGLDDPATMFFTAFICSKLLSILRSKHLQSKRKYHYDRVDSTDSDYDWVDQKSMNYSRIVLQEY